RHRARAEPDPGRGAPDRRLPDAADRPGRRSDRREPVAAGGHPGARARDRAAPRRRTRRGAPRARGRGAAGAARPTVSLPPRACLFGTYDAGHSANRLLGLALARAGWRVAECHEPLWEETRTKGRRYFGVRSLARLGVRWAAAARRLGRRWRRLDGPPPLVVVGFGGQLDVLLARRLCRPRAGLVFAPLVSLTETLVDDRRLVAPGGPPARALAWLDRASLGAADLVLADTEAHAEYLAGLGAPGDRVAVWYLGVEPEFLPAVAARPAPRRVLFYGRPLPLHGVETIVLAAARLGTQAEVVLLGDGPHRASAEALARRAGARIAWRGEAPLAPLPAEPAAAALVPAVLGAGREPARGGPALGRQGGSS